MKKISVLLLILFVFVMAIRQGLAQEVTITITPGWNWIACPMMDTLDFEEAMGSFTPMAGDIIKSRYHFAEYYEGVWVGNIQKFFPGSGYHYKSNRTEPVTLTFQMQQPVLQTVVTTSEPSDVTATSAVVGGTVTIDEGNHVYARGVCWGTEQMSNVDGDHTSNGTDAGTFTTILIGLASSTTYYVRAYAVTDYGLAYGEEQSFTTLEHSGNDTVPEGAIDGLFSVSTIQQVYFSQGNLQYQYQDSVTEIWRFAENQYDYIGNANNGWRDLFGWGTSGYDHGANCYQPWGTSTTYGDYYAYGNWNSNLSDQSGMADWGYNAISNGGNQENLWRTLSQSEWDYVLFARNTISGIRFAKATIREQVIDTVFLMDTIVIDTVFHDVHGIVLLPDNWSESAYSLNDSNVVGAPYETNVIMVNMWEVLEACGVVFLPAAGYRYGASTYNYQNSYGYYWSSTYDDSRYAYSMDFSDNWIYSDDSFYRYFGRSVRLVRNAE